jgi:hypothetical protein
MVRKKIVVMTRILVRLGSEINSVTMFAKAKVGCGGGWWVVNVVRELGRVNLHCGVRPGMACGWCRRIIASCDSCFDGTRRRRGRRGDN